MAKGKLRHIHIEPAANGYTVRAHHDMPPSDGKRSPMMDNESKLAVFTKKKHVMDHVSNLLSDHEGEPDADDMKAPKNHPIKKLAHKMY